ncbi:MAG: DUF1800 domain-containing protein [Betaproteobacteria bacterium]|nr:DUF1800 domain-containing protein [Betaproteobacteria bacterium]
MTLLRLPPLLAIAACALAAAACVPVSVQPTSKAIGYSDARHLLARTGFGPTAAEVRKYATLAREEAVAELLRDARTSPVTPPPAWATDTGALRLPRGESASSEERQAFRQQQNRSTLELRAWWLSEMLATPSALTERMTLFWHNHFVSSQQKVRLARLMYAQNATFREHALGNFAVLLRAAAKEPAMLVYLDSAQNRKGQPNENFAREVMELFTLGEGSYTEHDVKEAARAFTGWSLNRDTGGYQFRPGLHDNGMKTVFARSGHFDGDAVLDLLLARPETAEHLTRKLWREFVSEEPETHEVHRIAQSFRNSNYDIKTVLRGLLLSDTFWSEANRGVLIKSPVELVVGALRQLEIEPGPASPFALVSAGMGQNLFSPPNVKGWPGGEAWINTHTLLARKQFLDRLVRDVVPTVWLGSFPGTTQAEKMEGAQALLLPLPSSARGDVGSGGILDASTFVRAMLHDPAYQLK